METLGALRELTLDDLEAPRLKGVAEPELRPFTALGVFLALAEVLAGGDFFFFLLLLVGVGDLEVALEEAGVDNLDLDEVGVSERSTVSTYLGFCTDLLALEAEAGGVNSSSSESMSRCVLERRLELVRPLMFRVNYASNLRRIHYLSNAGKQHRRPWAYGVDFYQKRSRLHNWRL